MLRALSIRDILLIDRLELEFQPGLNVLTGETGAGKSILLDCLGFVLGWRGRADLTRSGAEQGEVTAIFDLGSSHGAWGVLAEAGLDADEGEELILRRTNSADGRKRAFVNDRPVSGEVLRQLSEHLVELHGQHDDKGLLNARNHRAMLDAFGQLDSELAACRGAWKERKKAQTALDTAQEELEAAAKDAEFLRHAATELIELQPQPGEEAALDRDRRLMQVAEKIQGEVDKAVMAVGSDGAETQLADAIRWLETAAEKVPGVLQDAIAALSRAINELAEAERCILEAQERLETDPSQLEQVEERLFAIRGLARKHNVQPDELAGMAADFTSRLDRIELGEGEIRRLESELAQAEAVFDRLADALSEVRHKAAEALDRAVMNELAPLKLERAEFETEISEAAPGPDGCDQVRFTVATNPGAPAGPIDRIASGGELSRFLLALKVCLTAQVSGQTLIFDEIDRGVGGATADAVGRRLSALSEKEQVIVVTHSPQVAARGDHHWQVAKSVQGETTLTTVKELSQTARREEIARMLAGEVITEEAKEAARVLLAG